MTAFVLVHSPLVGPATCAPLAAELRSRGHRVILPSLLGTLTGGPGWVGPQVRAVRAAVDAAGDGGPFVLVAHSGAGPLCPAIGAALGGARAYLFLDAAPPRPGRSWWDVAPESLVAHLESMAVGGWLPPWNEWFPEEDMTVELPDPAVRRAVQSELERLPLGMFAEPAPDIPGWPDAPCGYLRLAPAYDDFLADARSRGWRTASLDAHHLSPAADPVAVADAVLGLLGSAGD
ncbi:MAG TPA: hypothetical protein VFX70_16160 [Mycobacteriales bacterium]|nr:hypothetical protein [Mycobacteriales bacterium]